MVGRNSCIYFICSNFHNLFLSMTFIITLILRFLSMIWNIVPYVKFTYFTTRVVVPTFAYFNSPIGLLKQSRVF